MKLFNLIRYYFARYRKPTMIFGYKNAAGIYLKDTRISNSTRIDTPENLNIADNVFIGHFNLLEASHGIVIEEGCQITNYISIITHSSHISIRLYGSAYRYNEKHKGYVIGDVKIGKYTFIGPHSTIMPNTRIGKGCIVSAYSLVKGDFPDFSIIKGNPAVVIGSTKDLDEQYLKNDPGLNAHYEAWSKD
ncbi:MAG: acyltransferase [Flavobacteriales bacterium]|nr:acyltransferase [Flavobacteriales bacterium]